MKKLFLSLAALMLAGVSAEAKDLALHAAQDWSGVYVGGQFLGDFTKFNEVRPLNLANSTNLGGGLNAQYLRQKGKLVFGLATSADLFLNGSKLSCEVGGPSFQCQSGSSLDANIRAKLGFADGRVLVYGTAGWGWSSAYNRVWNVAGVEQSDTHMLSGWVAGAGLSYAFSPKWVGTVEYLHYDLGSGKITNFVAYGTANTKPVSDTFSVGISYKF